MVPYRVRSVCGRTIWGRAGVPFFPPPSALAADWISAEAFDPILVAKNGNGVAIGDAVIVRSEHAAQGCSDPEYGKIGARHELALNAVGLAADADIHGAAPTAKHAAEDRVVIAKIRVHGVGQFILPVIRSVVISAAPKLDQLFGIFHGQEAQQHLIDQGEDGSIRANPQGQGQDGDDGEGRRLGERAEGEADVVSETRHVQDTVERTEGYEECCFPLN